MYTDERLSLQDDMQILGDALVPEYNSLRDCIVICLLNKKLEDISLQDIFNLNKIRELLVGEQQYGDT